MAQAPAAHGIQQIGTDYGSGASQSDKLKMFLTMFSGEVLKAFDRTNVSQNRHTVRSIKHGKAASFPVLGRTTARYLEAGESLDATRTAIKGTEKVITVDGLLVSDVLIADIEDAMNHFDVRGEYSKQLGESLAMSYDGAIFAEIAKAVNKNDASNGSSNLPELGKPVRLTIPTVKSQKGNKPETEGKEILQALAKAQAQLNTQYVPQGERYFYCKPEVYAAISAAFLPTVANYASLSDPSTGTLKNIFGFEVIQVPHLTIGGSNKGGHQQHVFPPTGVHTNETNGNGFVGADNVVGVFMHRSAIGTVKLRDMKIERARRPELQADMIIAKNSMGHGLLRPEALGALVYTNG